jgi:hypothetical protein
MRLSLVVVCALASSAGAEPKALTARFVELTAGQLDAGGEIPGATPPRFAFTYKAAAVSPKGLDESATLLSDYATIAGDTVAGASADGKSAWLTVDIAYAFPCGMEGCDKMVPPRTHASGLLDMTGHAFVWHVGQSVVFSKKPPAPKRGKPIAPAKLPTGIDTGAEDAAKLFKASLADPKALAKTISDRKDAVLLGSEAAERYVGGATIRKTLASWNLAFTVRDGIQAGVTPSKTTAWVAANVDAGKPGDKASTPYRVLAIYDKKGSEWQLVLLHFSTVTADIK